MSMRKTILLSLLGFSAIAISATAFAVIPKPKELTIHNLTSYPSTARINSGHCSNQFSGVTPAGQTKTFEPGVVGFACTANLVACKAEVFVSDHCAGNKIATVTFHVEEGIKNMSIHDAHYMITESVVLNDDKEHSIKGFEITVMPVGNPA